MRRILSFLLCVGFLSLFGLPQVRAATSYTVSVSTHLVDANVRYDLSNWKILAGALTTEKTGADGAYYELTPKGSAVYMPTLREKTFSFNWRELHPEDAVTIFFSDQSKLDLLGREILTLARGQGLSLIYGKSNIYVTIEAQGAAIAQVAFAASEEAPFRFSNLFFGSLAGIPLQGLALIWGALLIALLAAIRFGRYQLNNL